MIERILYHSSMSSVCKMGKKYRFSITLRASMTAQPLEIGAGKEGSWARQ